MDSRLWEFRTFGSAEVHRLLMLFQGRTRLPDYGCQCVVINKRGITHS